MIEISREFKKADAEFDLEEMIFRDASKILKEREAEFFEDFGSNNLRDDWNARAAANNARYYKMR